MATSLRDRLPKAPGWLRAAGGYALLLALGTVGYLALLFGLSLLLNQALPGLSPLTLGLLLAVLALLVVPALPGLRRRLSGLLNRPVAEQEDLISLSRELTEALDLVSVADRLREHIRQRLDPEAIHIFALDADEHEFTALPEGPRPTSDLRFRVDGPLAETLRAHRKTWFPPATGAPAALAGDRARLNVLGAVAFTPIFEQDHLVGWIALGPRRAGGPYDRQAAAYLEALADQAALAIARARTFANLERRVRELNVLTRVAQAINFTRSFDDLLELIYTQTTHLIPAEDFRIALAEEPSDRLLYAFVAVGTERLYDLEGQEVPEDGSLLARVAREGAPLRVPDYQAACLAEGIEPERPLHAWMAVPLHAGTRPLGAIALGSANPEVEYTEDQFRFFQAIGEQAAGAIVKARLYQQAEERARQLATLNQAAAEMAATLELAPLLQRILARAVELTESEAGLLALADEDTGDLVIQVASGPFAAHLPGRRVTKGRGLLGAVAESGKPLRVDRPEAEPRWPSLPEEAEGLEPRALLLAPLQAKDRVVGVLEVVNKRDQAGYDEDDLALLAAFAAQAAVAVENARLYTLTDQALAARVEELSVMQRIDRDLSATLDFDRALEITLSWALRHTGADAGLIVVPQEDRAVARVAMGYPEGYEPEAGQEVPAELGALQEVLRSGEARRVGDLATQAEVRGLHPAARSLAAVPLLREGRAVAAMLLESRQAYFFNDDRLAFLTRLADHASIALANALLYAEVQAANLAKTEFVSFVSHELKTPMTSIKGYADLLAQGTVGPINEAQANFLNTIRSNVDRMATLVSDLSDISRIEAGRLRLEFEAVPIAEVVEEVVRSVRERVEAKEQHLEVQMPEDLPPAWGDRTRLIQVLTNLVSNANKYTPQGGRITLTVEATENRWDPEGAPRVLHLAVADTGIGISEEDQARIFQKFFRSEDPAVSEVPGTGLGLNIAKNLVELQGGRIWFESTYGKGSTFHFTVPVADPEEAEPSPA